MVIQDLFFSNFRNYEQLRIQPSPGVNLICGENAQGKTNLLEGIFFLSCVKGFHAKKERELIQFGKHSARLEAQVATKERQMHLQIDLFENAKRKIYENKILQKKLFDYVGTVQTVVFSPDDLLMIKEGPANRRKFLNIAISQLKPNYISALAEYNRVLEHKNKLLKEDYAAKRELLAVFNEQAAKAGAAVIHYRSAFVEELQRHASVIHREMANREEQLSIRYVTDRYAEPGATIEQIARGLLAHMEERTIAEIEAASCLVGPHKDDLEILIDEKPAKFFASQGQIRTAVLSMKMAEREVFRERTGELPILLLDDVLSELDQHRQHYILHKIAQGQVFLSSCSNLVIGHDDVQSFEIQNGCVL